MCLAPKPAFGQVLLCGGQGRGWPRWAVRRRLGTAQHERRVAAITRTRQHLHSAVIRAQRRHAAGRTGAALREDPGPAVAGETGLCGDYPVLGAVDRLPAAPWMETTRNWLGWISQCGLYP